MADIKNLHPVLQDKLAEFVSVCGKAGITVGITQGFRSTAYQNQLYAQGRTKPGNIITNCRGGYSPHNYGLAFDFVIMEKGVPVWNSSDSRWAKAGAIGQKLGLEWGGSWKNFPDKPHLQFMFGLTTAQLLAGAKIPTVVKVPGTRWLTELKEQYLVRVGVDIYSKLQRLNSPSEMAGLRENQLVRIGNSVYKNLNA